MRGDNHHRKKNWKLDNYVQFGELKKIKMTSNFGQYERKGTCESKYSSAVYRVN